jgi:hypothetical protein
MPGTTSNPQFNKWYDRNYERETFESAAEYADHRKVAFAAYKQGVADEAKKYSPAPKLDPTKKRNKIFG